MSRWNVMVMSAVVVMLPGWAGAEELVSAPVTEVIRFRAQGLNPAVPGATGFHSGMWGQAPAKADGVVQAIMQARTPMQAGENLLPWPVLRESAAYRQDKACVANLLIGDTLGSLSRPVVCSTQSPTREIFRKELVRLGYVVKATSDSVDSGEAWPGTSFQALYSPDGKLRFFLHVINAMK
jgi:hypothetical protein